MAGNEFDFDELDKAVNHVMGGGSASSKPDKSPDESPVKEPDAIEPEAPHGEDNSPKHEESPDDEPVETVEVNTPENTEPKPAPKPVAYRPNTGRVMDIHPSAGVGKRPDTSEPRLEVPSRPDSDQDAATDAEPPDDDASQTPFLPDANDKVEKRPLGTVNWPFSKKNQALSTDTEEPESPVGVNEVPPTESDNVETETVESVTATTAYGEHDAPKDAESGEDLQLPPDLPDLSPKEASEMRELSSIESQTIEQLEHVPDEKEASISQVESGDTEHLHGGDEDHSHKHKHHDNESKDVKTSESAGIYDTKEYHQPLGHPAKRKSGWHVVFITVLIILLCAGLATMAYFLLVLGYHF